MKRICITISALAVVLCISACGTKDVPQEAPDPAAFFSIIENGQYYVKLELFLPTKDGIIFEVAADGENIERFTYFDGQLVIRQLALGDLWYLISDESRIISLMENTDDTDRITPSELYLLLPFQHNHNGEGFSKLDSDDNPDETEYYYQEYYATVGELRDRWLLADSTPDDNRLILRVYYSGNDLYAYSYFMNDEMLYALRIYEFSQEIPDRFTFSVPTDYEWRSSQAGA